MRGFALAALLLSLGACGQSPPQQADPGTPSAQRASTVKTPAPSVEGWQTDITAFALNGATLAPFNAKQDNGAELTQASLRDHWTILGFQQATDAPGEAAYVAALNSAADQDPDLDYLGVVIVRGSPAPAHSSIAWPHIDDSGAFADALEITGTPAYLLIGPDLTIEGYRGALSATPDDGIKSVIRGVAQIRKQVAAPE